MRSFFEKKFNIILFEFDSSNDVSSWNKIYYKMFMFHKRVFRMTSVILINSLDQYITIYVCSLYSLYFVRLKII